MLLTKKCLITRKVNTLDIPLLNEEDYVNWINTPIHQQELIQNAFPFLTSDEREFIITGLLPGEFDDLVGEEEPDEED